MDIRRLFSDIKTDLEKIVPKGIIEHVGGSSIAGAVTKGDLDISIQVEEEDFISARKALEKIFTPIHVERLWKDYFAVFRDRRLSIQVDIMLVVIGSPFDRFVYIRDRLLTDPHALEEYNTLKERYGKVSEEEYRSRKREFFDRLEKE